MLETLTTAIKLNVIEKKNKRMRLFDCNGMGTSKGIPLLVGLFVRGYLYREWKHGNY
jgi:hypothetical protein